MGNPSLPALKDAHHHTFITYHHLNQQANKLARCLLRQLRSTPCSNPDGDRVVAVCMAPSSELVTTLLAIHKAGAAYLPLDVTFPESRVTHILQDSRPGLVLAHGHPQNLHQTRVPVLHLEDLESEVTAASGDDLSGQEVGITVSSDSIAVILYTSGSTGIPKGVRVSHRAVLNRLAWQWSTFPYQKDEVGAFKTALTFVDSISEIFGPLLTGHRIVVVPKWMTVAVEELVRVLEVENIGRMVLVPSLLRSILLHCAAQPNSPLPALRLWVCSGEVFPPDLLQTFFKIFNNGQAICNFYGSTEVMGDVTYLKFNNLDEAKAKLVSNKVPIGVPVLNCCIYLLDNDGELVKEGHTGEIYAAGLSVATSYVGGVQPDKFVTNRHSEDSVFSTLYRTGDFGRVVDGGIVFEGRKDSQIKVRGHRVDMTEVEVALKKVKAVDKAYVLCYKPGEITQALVAFYTSTDGILPSEEVASELNNLLQPYMQPQLVMVEELPLLVNGKVDRQQLLRLYEAKAQAGCECVEVEVSGASPEQQEAALVLLQTVARVLGPAAAGHQPLSLSASFFNLGGNSLNSVLTVTSLEDLGYTVGIGQFMRAKSLMEVLEKMEKSKKENEDSVTPNCVKKMDDHQYQIDLLQHSHKEAVTRLISKSFSELGDLEQWLDMEHWVYEKLLHSMYDTMVECNLSFVVTRKGTNEVVACALNTDVHDEPPITEVSPKLQYILDFLEHCEEPARIHLPEETGTVVHSFMMGTLLELPPSEKVDLIQIMEEENLKVAERNNYKAVFTTNTSALTQQVCDDLMSYKVLKDTVVNTWVASDGTQPFQAAPDTQHAVTTVKFL
ncbi:hypothetical protein Pmani_015324 [Petrolisthes manimaculis]|uniref:Carrier domain-containing protein n=1 Tax=Petrolisthes manimaculis TaxID=1843537 RepID=A0AAE1PR59_9EUCA|nr:hypothetical protein Pmani_015324 [Petrolisthes manimaculis]